MRIAWAIVDTPCYGLTDLNAKDSCATRTNPLSCCSVGLGLCGHMGAMSAFYGLAA
jgi:hypothetical protein